jgi:hypothetical protein
MNRQTQIDRFVAQAHALAVQRLREQPARMGEVQARLRHWRALAGPTRSDIYWNEWEALLAGSVELLAAAVCADTDHATALRSVSPMSVLITQAERAQFLTAARHSA